MLKDLYSKIYVHFGVDSVENLIANQRNRFFVFVSFYFAPAISSHKQ